jgi:hypothetical protein
MESGLTRPDRRRSRRASDAAEHGIVRARVRPGHAAVVIDVSPDGVLIETAHRLLPGTTVDVHLESEERRESVRGRVLRSAVARVRASGIAYRGAIRFESALTRVLPVQERAPHTAVPGSQVPTDDRAIALHEREMPTRLDGSAHAGANANVQRF